MNAWGQHLILDCADCDLKAITDRDHIQKFVKTLIEKIEMIAYGTPQIELLLEGSDNEGYSVLQMITTSNITAHFVSKTGAGYIDVFSCSSFDEKIVKLVVDEFFKPSSIKDRMFYRNA
jgi:S-adenosylmethionine/arginine decarboxylase-like enzyme